MLTIYTDGAVSKNGQDGAYGGWGFVRAETDDYAFGGLPLNATNQICELKAIYEACKYAQEILDKTEENFPPETVVIRSDSAYVINCYKQKWYSSWQSNGWKNSKKEPVANKDLWELIIPYFENPRFTFEKVIGHSGDKYNELADKYANKGKAKAKQAREYFNKTIEERGLMVDAE